MPTGDLFCQCGCGGWLGQCRKQESVKQQSWSLRDEPDDIPVARTVTDRILMSDVLKDVIPEELSTNDGTSTQNFTIVILGRSVDGNENPVVGALVDIMFADHDIEIGIKIQLDDALLMLTSMPSTVNRRDISFNFIELHNGEDVTRFEPTSQRNTFEIKGVRLGEIDKQRGMCVLLLNLRD